MATIKAQRKEDKERRESLKTRSDYLKEAQKAANQYVRLRDEKAGLPCISCGRFHGGQWHCGHYRSVGSAPHLRFDTERNLARQCQPCNTHLHGNLVNYRLGLLGRIGPENVAALEADQTPRHYSIDDLKSMIKEYKEKSRILLCAV